MREIMFRGKKVNEYVPDDNDWVYGYNWYNLSRFISAHTIELDGSFQPPVSQIDATCLLNLDVNYYVSEVAGDLDQDSPDISHDPYADTFDIVGPYTISANITTPHGLTPGSTKLYWKNSSTWNEVPMVNVTAETWEAGIPGQPSGTWVSYYIFTEDLVSQESTHPNFAPYATHDFHVGADAVVYSVDLEPSEWEIVNLVVEAPDAAHHTRHGRHARLRRPGVPGAGAARLAGRELAGAGLRLRGRLPLRGGLPRGLLRRAPPGRLLLRGLLLRHGSLPYIFRLRARVSVSVVTTFRSCRSERSRISCSAIPMWGMYFSM